jgi:TorA maturation chaperone TorD
MTDPKINKARALYYGLFSRFFVFTTDNQRYLELIHILDTLKENPMDETTSQAFSNIRAVIKADSNVVFMQEFDNIFHSPQSKVLRTTASYYDEQIESGKKRVEMQNFLAKTKIRRDEKKYCDYEDHVGFIFTVMGELCELISQGHEEYNNTAHCIFEQILNGFIDEFAKELYEHETAVIFKEVAVILKAFIEFERIYLEVSKPLISSKAQTTEQLVEEISQEELERRARNKALKAQGPKKKQEVVDLAYDVESDI